MDDFVRALTHVHDGIDVGNQWKRATSCLKLMSNLEIALAWLQLSKHARKSDDDHTVLEFKVLYKRALREQDDKNPDNPCCNSHGSSHESKKIIREIRELRFILNSSGRRMRGGPGDDQSEHSEESMLPEELESSHTPSLIIHDPSPVPHVNTDASNLTEQPSAKTWKEMLEKCCKENQTVCEGIGKNVEGVKQMVEEIRTAQLALTARVTLDSEGMTELLDRECIAKLIPLADKLETTDQKVQQLLDRPDPAAKLHELLDEQAVRIQTDAAKSMESMQTAVTDLIKVKLDDIRETIYSEFQQQTTAIMEHEHENFAFVEQTAKTLESIPEILKSYETSNEKSSGDMLKTLAEIVDSINSSAVCDAELKKTVTQRIDSMVQLQKKTSEDLTQALQTALVTNSEMLKLVISMNKNRRSGSAFTTGGGGSTPSMPQRPGRPDKGWSTDESSDSDGEHGGAAASRAVAIDKSGAAIPKQVLAVLPLSGATEKRRREKVAQTTAKKAAESLNAVEAAKKAAAKPPP